VYGLRFDMRVAPDGSASATELYRAAIEMAEWGEVNGCQRVLISEHHRSPDGYLPSPLVLATAIAARTTSVPIVIGALLLNFYDPIKLAEDIAVLDIVSGGRVSYVIGLGYRAEEYEMFGVDMAARGTVMDHKLAALQRALRGEEFEYDGRRVQVTPAPVTPGGPTLRYGGFSLAAARRAGRFGLDMFAMGPTPGLEEAYRAAAAGAGVTPGVCFIPTRVDPTSVFVAEDVDAAWERIGPYLLHDVTMYRSWMGDAQHISTSRSNATTVAELRAENGSYRILTPAAATAILQAGRPLGLQPLSGGLPPAIAWESLRLVGELSRAVSA
jgi:alkanesulfonate monooxygenase SsuD/methylene tetrahydromethanopterin reductase-like flavin-dependent oxidoreductase (luciferase family)